MAATAGLEKDGKEAAYGEAIEAAEEGLRIAPEDHRLRAAPLQRTRPALHIGAGQVRP